MLFKNKQNNKMTKSGIVAHMGFNFVRVGKRALTCGVVSAPTGRIVIMKKILFFYFVFVNFLIFGQTNMFDSIINAGLNSLIEFNNSHSFSVVTENNDSNRGYIAMDDFPYNFELDSSIVKKGYRKIFLCNECKSKNSLNNNGVGVIAFRGVNLDGNKLTLCYSLYTVNCVRTKGIIKDYADFESKAEKRKVKRQKYVLNMLLGDSVYVAYKYCCEEGRWVLEYVDYFLH